MIALGTWSFNVTTMFFKGEAKLRVFDDNGKYGFAVSLPGMDTPDFEIKEIKEEGNTLSGILLTSLLRGKDIPFELTVENEVASGYLKAPYLGKVNLKNGKKVAD